MFTAADQTQDDKSAGRPVSVFNGTIFLHQEAHVTIIDGQGGILAVNDAWEHFGRENGVDPNFRFRGASYPKVCKSAVDSALNGRGAREALEGVNRVLSGNDDRFSLVYPCHAPQQQRWFLMHVRPIGSELTGAVVSHIDVTSLHLAGLIPDDTAPPPTASAPGPASKAAQMLFGDGGELLAAIASRLR